MFKALYILSILTLSFVHVLAQTNDTILIRELIDKFFETNQKDKYSKQIIKLKPNYDLVYNHLKFGKKYSSNVPKGFWEHNFKNEIGVEHPNLVFIPYSYDHQQKYRIRIFLHGGVSTFNMREWVGSIDRSDTIWSSLNTINLFPASWVFSKWWSYSQYENISKLLAYVKENYNIDENMVYITGISDGGTGIYYLSNFYQTPFSCYLPFIGSMETLHYLYNKQLYVSNYQGLNFYIVNGRKDEVFDINYVIPTINELKKVSNEVKFFIVDSSSHNMKWYPTLKDSIKLFINQHKRNPFPDLVNFSTEKPDTFGRKFWVKIEKIGIKKEVLKDELNTTMIYGKNAQIFPRTRTFGQIEVSKKGNVVTVKTKNVIKYTLLISPSHFDFGEPIEVYTNGILSFKGFVSKSLETLLKYYILDNDREMLYASEIEIKVGKAYKD